MGGGEGAPGARAMLLEGVSFDVQYRDRVALVGPNGEGKTTLLRLIRGCAATAVGEDQTGHKGESGRAFAGR